MNSQTKVFTVCLLIGVMFLTNCKKDASSTGKAKSFTNLTFNHRIAFFASDGSMAAPVDSFGAKASISKIDITFFNYYDYDGPGFFDPVARSSDAWYWDQFCLPWLKNGMATKYYSTKLTKADFDAAVSNQSKIATFFASSDTKLAGHDIYPVGAVIGGREANSVELKKGGVYGFMNAAGKRGFIYVRTDQATAWPIAVVSQDTKVDIVREN